MRHLPGVVRLVRTASWKLTCVRLTLACEERSHSRRDPFNDRSKARMRPNRVEGGIEVDKRHLEGALKPVESRCCLTECSMNGRHIVRWYVSHLCRIQQASEPGERLITTSSERVRGGDVCRTTIRVYSSAAEIP